MKAKISEAEELQLPMFYLNDSKNIVKNLYHIVDNYAGEYKYEVGDKIRFTKDSLGNTIIPSRIGDALAIKYKDQTFYVPLGIAYSEKKEVLKKISLLNLKKIGREKALLNLMESMYKYDDADCMLRIAVLIYKNMDQDRRESKSGKELKKYIDSYTLNAISWGTAKNDARSLKDLLDVCTLDEEMLRWAINTYEDTASPEVKAYLLDAMGKAKRDKNAFDI